MSRIQDALDKLSHQRGNDRAGGGPLGRAVESRGMLSASPHPSVQQVHHRYRQDRQVEVSRPALRRAGLLVAESQTRLLAEEYRQIKRPLLANASGTDVDVVDRANLIMIGSALPGEGKTFTAINLCLSIALERDWSVVLVDGDIAKPHLTELFGLQNEPGLVDLLRSADGTFDQYTLPTDVPGLAVMPAGRGDEYTFELLASARMNALARQLATGDRQRMVVFDSSPLLATSEAPALSVHVGQVILVVCAEHTPRQRVQEGIAKLDANKANNLILNKARLKRNTVTYGGRYGYGSAYKSRMET